MVAGSTGWGPAAGAGGAAPHSKHTRAEKFLGSAEYRSINEFYRFEPDAWAILTLRSAPSGAFLRLTMFVSVPITEFRAVSSIIPPTPA